MSVYCTLTLIFTTVMAWKKHSTQQIESWHAPFISLEITFQAREMLLILDTGKVATHRSTILFEMAWMMKALSMHSNRYEQHASAARYLTTWWRCCRLSPKYLSVSDRMPCFCSAVQIVCAVIAWAASIWHWKVRTFAYCFEHFRASNNRPCLGRRVCEELQCSDACCWWRWIHNSQCCSVLDVWNISSCRTRNSSMLLTACMCDSHLQLAKDRLPYNEYFEYYGPDYRLHIHPSNMENQNDRAYLDETTVWKPSIISWGSSSPLDDRPNCCKHWVNWKLLHPPRYIRVKAQVSLKLCQRSEFKMTRKLQILAEVYVHEWRAIVAHVCCASNTIKTRKSFIVRSTMRMNKTRMLKKQLEFLWILEITPMTAQQLAQKTRGINFLHSCDCTLDFELVDEALESAFRFLSDSFKFVYFVDTMLNNCIVSSK